jgi:hypothetical protein
MTLGSAIEGIFLRPALPPLAIAVIAAVAVALAVASYVRAEGSISWRGSLLLLRVIGLLAVASVLLGPSRVPPTAERELRPRVTVLLDVSASMAMADCDGKTRFEQVRTEWMTREAITRLNAVAEVDLRIVGEVTEPMSLATIEGLDASAASAKESRLLDGLLDAVLAGDAADGAGHRILLLSDGRDTSGQSSQALVEIARKRRVPIDAVCVGAAVERRDLIVQAVPTQEFLYAEEEGTLLVRLQQIGLPIGETGVELTVNGPEGEKTSRHTIDLRGRTIGEIEIPIRHALPGQYEYLVRCEARPEELDTANNAQSLFLDVSKAKASVLMLEAQPSWDMKFIAQSLRKDPRVRLVQVSRLSERRTEIIRSGDASDADATPEARDADSVRDDLATILSAEGIAEVDVFILGTGLERLLTTESAFGLRDAVLERGAGVIFARGPAVGADADLVGIALGAIEPVRFDRTVREAPPPAMRIGFTSSAGSMPWLQRDRIGVDLFADADRLAAWPLLRPVLETKPATIVLARGGEGGASPDFADDPDAPPAIVTMRAGRGVVVAMLGEGMWKWALVDGERAAFRGVYERCWQGMVRWVASGGDTRPGQDVTLRVGRQSAAIGGSVEVEVVLDRSSATPPREVRLARPDGRVESLPLAVAPSDPRRLRSSFVPEGTGVHMVTLESPGLLPERQQRVLNAFDPSPERVNASADPRFMAQLANATGGSVFAVDRAADYPDHVRKRRFATIASGEPAWVWNRASILIMLCAWLGAEWILRRKAGLP